MNDEDKAVTRRSCDDRHRSVNGRIGMMLVLSAVFVVLAGLAISSAVSASDAAAKAEARVAAQEEGTKEFKQAVLIRLDEIREDVRQLRGRHIGSD